jgi:hypothetical protein
LHPASVVKGEKTGVRPLANLEVAETQTDTKSAAFRETPNRVRIGELD